QPPRAIPHSHSAPALSWPAFETSWDPESPAWRATAAPPTSTLAAVTTESCPRCTTDSLSRSPKEHPAASRRSTSCLPLHADGKAGTHPLESRLHVRPGVSNHESPLLSRPGR